MGRKKMVSRIDGAGKDEIEPGGAGAVAGESKIRRNGTTTTGTAKQRVSTDPLRTGIHVDLELLRVTGKPSGFSVEGF